jgi:hypothetical protein
MAASGIIAMADTDSGGRTLGDPQKGMQSSAIGGGIKALGLIARPDSRPERPRSRYPGRRQGGVPGGEMLNVSISVDDPIPVVESLKIGYL